MNELMKGSSLHLEKLILDGYKLLANHNFLAALASQRHSLTVLVLRSPYGEDADPVLPEAVAQSISTLKNLAKLELNNICRPFGLQETSLLTHNLGNLKELRLTPGAFDDSLWSQIILSSRLQVFEIEAETAFTPRGILSFITRLKSQKRCFSKLRIMNTAQDASMSRKMKRKISRVMARKVNGEFAFGTPV